MGHECEYVQSQGCVILSGVRALSLSKYDLDITVIFLGFRILISPYVVRECHVVVFLVVS